MSDRTAILVCGLARSGTSALSGVLDALGVPFAGKLKPEDEWNQRGNFEHHELSMQNQFLLRSFGSHWSDERPFPPNWESLPGVLDYQQKIRDLLERDFKDLSLFGLKDPRLCVLLPLYLNALEELGISARLVVSHRPVPQVYASLLKTPYMKGECTLPRIEALHRKYHDSIKVHRGQTPLLEIHYQELLHHSEKQFLRIESFLSDVLEPREERRSRALAFLDPGLCHHSDPSFFHT